jgi:serine protease Do
LETTVSAGIISAKGRGIEKIKRGRLFQTDAAINPGNSGGPLVNLDGEVIGISTAIATSNGGYQGVGFAIPGNRAQWIWKELAEHGKVRRAYLGIGIDELTAADANALATTARAGVWVRRVYPDGPGAAAGLKENDVIVEFADVTVRMPRDLQDVVEQSPIGMSLPMQVLRQGQRIQVQVVLQAFEE